MFIFHHIPASSTHRNVG